MMDHVELLYQDYQKSRRIRMPKPQFVYILKMYPALLVCMSDGVLDKEEWDGIVMATRGLASEFVTSPTDNQDMIAMSFRTEMRYLLDNVDKWKKKFLNALHFSIKNDKLDQEFVLETMYLFANITDGISEEEESAISELTRRLDIDHVR